MEPTASSALTVAIIAVVLGGIGLIGGVIGYVQGTNAVARATHARQRAVVAEEEALQARTAAEATARAAEELLDQIRAEAARATQPPVTGPVVAPMPTPTTGATLLPTTTGPTRLPLGTGPVVVTPVTAAVPTPPVIPEAAHPRDPDDEPDALAVPAEQQPAEHFEVPLPTVPEVAEPSEEAPSVEDDAEPVPSGDLPVADSAGEALPEEPEPDVDLPVAEPAGEAVPEDSEPDVEPSAPRDERGRVAAGAQDDLTMDWAEVLKTGAIPLPSISRGTYAAPRRRPRPTGEGPARFELRAVGRQRYEAVNVGGEPAEEAQIEGGGDDPHLVRPLSARPSTVAPAGALAFSVLRVEGRHPSVAVAWTRDGEPVRQDLPID